MLNKLIWAIRKHTKNYRVYKQGEVLKVVSKESYRGVPVHKFNVGDWVFVADEGEGCMVVCTGFIDGVQTMQYVAKRCVRRDDRKE